MTIIEWQNLKIGDEVGYRLGYNEIRIIMKITKIKKYRMQNYYTGNVTMSKTPSYPVGSIQNFSNIDKAIAIKTNAEGKEEITSKTGKKMEFICKKI